EEIDHAVGVVLHKKRGDVVTPGETLAEIHARDEAGAETAVEEGLGAHDLGDQPPPQRGGILDVVAGRGPGRGGPFAGPGRADPRGYAGSAVPELPEVETVRASLKPRLVGRRFEDVQILDARLTRPVDPAEVAAELSGELVEAVDRRGKYLILR